MAPVVLPMRKKPTDRDDVGVEPGGPLVKIYTSKSYRGVPIADTFWPFWSNNRKYNVRMGGECIVPKDVYTQMKNCQSRRTVPVDPRQAERLADLGIRTDRTASQAPPVTQDAMCDFEIVYLGEVGKREV